GRGELRATRAQLLAAEATVNAQLLAAEATANAQRLVVGDRAGWAGSLAENLAPVNSSLRALAERLALAERAEAQARDQLSEQLSAMARLNAGAAAELGRETRRLVAALSRSDVRGRWGEMQLRRLLQASGLIAGVHYREQVSLEEGALRPDVVIQVDSQLAIVIDAKVSLASFLSVEAADSGPELEAALDAHAREVRKHVDRLAGKEYWRALPDTPRMVVMFLPAESLLAEAAARDPHLLEHAFSRDVIPATPTTLLALLRTVGQVARSQAVATNAGEIQALGRELHDRLRLFCDHLDKVGAGLTTAVTGYNKAVGTLESRVLVSGRRFADLQTTGAGEGAGTPQLEAPRLVDLAVREVSSVN
ncbi:MAG: DNA recombination protein RmuC, partial [Candidatus Nanopelagicales bacterium]